VPSPVWRVVLCLLTFFLVTAYAHLIPASQHAYQPGKGTLSAWEEILRSVRHRRFIWEFDIKGFFDNVRVDKAVECLGKEMPKKIGSVIKHMAAMAPKLPSEHKLDERAAELKSQYESDPGVYTREVLESNPPADLEIDDELDAEMLAMAMLEGSEIEYEKDSVNREIEDKLASQRYKGFPQGAALSAFMSILYLAQIKLPEGIHLTMYADDGMVSSDQPFDEGILVAELERLGLSISPAKCK
jgi:hypothetical protein